MRTLIAVCLALLSVGCSHPESFRDQYLTAYHQGAFQEAEQTLSSRIPSDDYRKNRDAVWLLLERATVRFASADSDGAIADYRLALEAIDYYYKDVSTETTAQLLIDDAKRGYAGTRQEQLLARLYFALALHDAGDLTNATALLRQAENWQQQRVSEHRAEPALQRLVQSALAKYLLAASLEQEGDLSNAQILYDQASDLAEGPLPQSQPNDARVIVLAHAGNVPVRVSAEADGSEVMGFAAETMLATTGKEPAISSLVPVRVPELLPVHGGEAHLWEARIGRQRQRLLPIHDVAMLAYDELDEDFPKIAGRAAARMLIRRGAVLAVEEADKDLQPLADLGVLIANLNTHADIRCWSTLPNLISLADFDLSSGTHRLTLSNDRGETYTDSITLRRGDLCIINLFNIHPGVLQVLIPERFKKAEGDIL